MAAKIQVVFYSMYGHVYRMAEAVAEGARGAGADVELLKVPELIPDAALEKSGAKAAQAAFAHVPLATVDHLVDADAIIFGTPTRFGNMAAQMRNFLDQTGGLWMKGALIGKVGSVFTATATQHGGQESTILTTPRDAAAPRHGDRRRAVLRAADLVDRGDERRQSLRRRRHHGRRRVASAQRRRAGHREVPGRPRGEDRRETRGKVGRPFPGRPRRPTPGGPRGGEAGNL